MARLLALENVGRVDSKHNSFKAEIDTFYLGERYKFSGTPRGQQSNLLGTRGAPWAQFF